MISTGTCKDVEQKRMFLNLLCDVIFHDIYFLPLVFFFLLKQNLDVIKLWNFDFWSFMLDVDRQEWPKGSC